MTTQHHSHPSVRRGRLLVLALGATFAGGCLIQPPGTTAREVANRYDNVYVDEVDAEHQRKLAEQRMAQGSVDGAQYAESAPVPQPKLRKYATPAFTSRGTGPSVAVAVAGGGEGAADGEAAPDGDGIVVKEVDDGPAEQAPVALPSEAIAGLTGALAGGLSIADGSIAYEYGYFAGFRGSYWFPVIRNLSVGPQVGFDFFYNESDGSYEEQSGGYDSFGNYNGYGPYDSSGNYVAGDSSGGDVTVYSVPVTVGGNYRFGKAHFELSLGYAYVDTSGAADCPSGGCDGGTDDWTFYYGLNVLYATRDNGGIGIGYSATETKFDGTRGALSLVGRF